MNLKDNKKIKIFLIVFLTIFIFGFIIIPYIIDNKAFVVGLDIRSQYNPFYKEFKNLFHTAVSEQKIPFWSWNLFFGSNFWASKTYYMLTDVFAYFSLMFNDHYYVLLVYQTLGKILLSVSTFYAYCYVRKFKFNTSLILSLCFGFSSWAMNFVGEPAFLYFYSLIPLYFVMIELFLSGKRKYLFSIVSGVMIVTNFYLFYTLSFFTVVYCLYRYYEIHGNFKNVFLVALNMIVYYFIGILCSLFIVLPSILLVMDNSRVGSFTSNFYSWGNIRVYLGLVMSMFYPTNVYVNRIGVINGVENFSSIYNTGKYATIEILFWSSNLVSILCVNSLFDKNHKRKRQNIYYFLFIGIASLFPIVSSLLHGFSEATFRWSAFAIFINLVISGYYLDDLSRVNKKVLIKTVIVITLIYFINLPLTSILTKQDISQFIDQYYKILLFLPLFWIYFYIIFKKKPIVFLTIFVVIELSCSAFLTFNDNIDFKNYSWDFVNSSEKVLGSYDSFDYYVKYTLGDNDFYRVYASYKEVYWFSSLNMNLIYGFPGTSTYDSLYNYSLDDLLLISNIDRANGWTWNVTQPDILDFVSVKYAFVTSEDQLPDDNYTYIDDYYGIHLYQNNNYRSVANTYSNLITYEQYATYDDPSMITSYIICHDDDYDNINSYINNRISHSAENVYTDLNRMSFRIKSDSVSFIVTSVAYDKGWKVLVDGKEVDTYKINGGFIGFGVDDEGNHEINMYFVPTGFKTGIYLSISGVFIFISLVVYEEITIKRKKSKK